MDRRSWLWQRKSSLEKSPGETESSGSMSSRSERLSSDDQAYSNPGVQSPEVTSKATMPPMRNEEHDENLKTLTDKLTAALRSVSAKENLVKQHAKVAEEAVSGWERSEKEVASLKHQVESVTLRNSTLEDRIGHLDGALKECLRQLRQARSERELKIQEAVAEMTRELESKNSDFERKLREAKDDGSGLESKLEMLERENSKLKLELSSMADELKRRTIEKDYSTQAAEMASKQHLDSIKKVSKLEAECSRLKMAAPKASTAASPSVHVESSPSNGSIGIKSSRALTESTTIAPFVKIENFMDDFLEMEKVAAVPECKPKDIRKHTAPDRDGVNSRAKFEAMVAKLSELEDVLKNTEAEKNKLEMALTKQETELNATKDLLRDAEAKLGEMETLLNGTNEARKAAQAELESSMEMIEKLGSKIEKEERSCIELQALLNTESELRRTAEAVLEDARVKKEMVELEKAVIETELEALLLRVGSLEEEVLEERASSGNMALKCEKLEDEISRMRREQEFLRAACWGEELEIKRKMELVTAETKFAECQKTIASLSRQLMSLASLDDFLIEADNTSELPIHGFPAEFSKTKREKEEEEEEEQLKCESVVAENI